jgi:hypothetical protein
MRGARRGRAPERHIARGPTCGHGEWRSARTRTSAVRRARLDMPVAAARDASARADSSSRRLPSETRADACNASAGRRGRAHGGRPHAGHYETAFSRRQTQRVENGAGRIDSIAPVADSRSLSQSRSLRWNLRSRFVANRPRVHAQRKLDVGACACFECRACARQLQFKRSAPPAISCNALLESISP